MCKVDNGFGKCGCVKRVVYAVRHRSLGLGSFPHVLLDRINHGFLKRIVVTFMRVTAFHLCLEAYARVGASLFERLAGIPEKNCA